MKYDHRCWIRGENDCDMKCDSKVFPTKENPCGWLCNACRCTSCNQSMPPVTIREHEFNISSHDLTQLQTKSNQAELAEVQSAHDTAIRKEERGKVLDEASKIIQNEWMCSLPEIVYILESLRGEP